MKIKKCDVCGGDFDHRDITTINPSRHLGESYPKKTAFCPTCFISFLRKAKSILKVESDTKLDNIKKLTNS